MCTQINIHKLQLLILVLSEKQKLSLDESKASDSRMSISERSLKSPSSIQSPATHENSNIVIYEVKEKLSIGYVKWLIEFKDPYY